MVEMINDIKGLEEKYEKIFVWGAGKLFCENFKNNIKIEYLIDSDNSKVGQRLKGIEIISPQMLMKMSVENAAIIIYSVFYEDIMKQIKNSGIHMDVYCVLALDNDLRSSYLEKKTWQKKSFALFAEDAIVKGIAERYKIAINHYVDVGANHPFLGNATYTFYLDGARGCLVEPNPEYVDLLNLIRPLDKVYNVGVGSDRHNEEHLNYYMVKELDTRNTFSQELADDYREKGFTVTCRKIAIMSLNRILDLYGEKINYISIDVEGFEFDILKDFDFRKYDVEIFNIEKGNSKVKELLLDNGYECCCETISDWIFVKKGLVDEGRLLQEKNCC